MDSHVWRKPRRSPSVRRAKIASATGYTELKICFEVHRALQSFVETILTLLESWSSQVAELRQRLENIFTTKVPATEGKETEDFSAWVQPFTRERCRQNHQPLNRLSRTEMEFNENWLTWMEKQAENFLLCFETYSLDSDPSAHPVAALCDGAAPQLQGVGGLHHSLLVLPNANFKEFEAQAKTILGEGVSWVLDPEQPAFLCCETRNLPFRAVSDSIGERREDLKQMAQRLQARTDIDW